MGFDLLTLVQLIGYPGIFGIIFAESGVLIGVFFPGASLLFASGVLAAAGVFNIWILVPGLIVAAVLGDSVGYWFGTKVGTALYNRPDSRFFRKEYLDKTKLFFDKYGTRAVVVARFIPIVRTFAPILAGVGSMTYKTFLFYNILGALLWAGGVTLLGYYLGRIIPDAEKFILPLVLIIVGITLIPLAIHWWQNRSAEMPKE
ncbi:VTT domain-containing protein [Candidatus Kaiserbacteria bacterium]|nr:VTT domain-containing protein [Candidatus Kaiserbacteria bacterium]